MDQLIAAWVPVTLALNALNRSLGQPDLYPFVLSLPVIEKLDFVHNLVRDARPPAETMRRSPAESSAHETASEVGSALSMAQEGVQ
jgi:hypothetical protein